MKLKLGKLRGRNLLFAAAVLYVLMGWIPRDSLGERGTYILSVAVNLVLIGLLVGWMVGMAKEMGNQKDGETPGERLLRRVANGLGLMAAVNLALLFLPPLVPGGEAQLPVPEGPPYYLSDSGDLIEVSRPVYFLNLWTDRLMPVSMLILVGGFAIVMVLEQRRKARLEEADGAPANSGEGG